MLEALGFAPPGKAVELSRSGALQIGGVLPTNTGGGLVGFGHPVGVHPSLFSLFFLFSFFCLFSCSACFFYRLFWLVLVF